MFGDSLIVGLIVLLLCGAALFYMYVRMTFLEKKFLVMESILIDLRVAMDSLMMEHAAHPPAPIATTPGINLPPVPENDAIPEETFYSSVLEQAHEKDVAQEGQTADAVLESFEQAAAATQDSGPATEPAPVKQNLDSMSRAELAALAESKGLRVKRSMNRGEVLNLLRRMDPTQNEKIPTGAENVSGSATGTQQLGASLDGSVSMDMEQGERLDQ
jgi:hypothetical protein